jgi:Tfp pilus assembly protein PilX
VVRVFGIANQRGIVLILAVFLLAALSLLGVAANKNVAIDTAISSNHLASVQSFYIAEAGLEKGQLEAAMRISTHDWATFTPLLNGTSAEPLGLIFGTTTPFGDGSYSVTVANDPADLTPTIDTNRTITIRSTGISSNSRSSAAATIRMLTAPKLPGAVSFLRDANTALGGGSYQVSGYDYTLDDLPDAPTGTSPARPGVALCETTTSGQTITTLRAVINKNNEVSGSTDVATSNDLTGAILDEYIADLKAVARSSVDCDTVNITYTASDLVVGCKAGRGLLIVDGNLDFSENTTWQGVIIVRGGIFKLNGSNTIRGGIVVEAPVTGVAKGANTGLEIGAKGNITLLYSSEAVNNANGALTGKQGKWTVLSWRRVR